MQALGLLRSIPLSQLHGLPQHSQRGDRRSQHCDSHTEHWDRAVVVHADRRHDRGGSRPDAAVLWVHGLLIPSVAALSTEPLGVRTQPMSCPYRLSR